MEYAGSIASGRKLITEDKSKKLEVKYSRSKSPKPSPAKHKIYHFFKFIVHDSRDLPQ